MKGTYTKIPNTLLNKICKIELSGASIRVLLFIIRYTKGFNRDSAKLSSTYIANGTGLTERGVKKCMKTLKEQGLISIDNPSRTATNIITLTSEQMDTRLVNKNVTTSEQLYTNTSEQMDTQERKEERKKENKNSSSYSASADAERKRRLKEIMEAEWIPDEI